MIGHGDGRIACRRILAESVSAMGASTWSMSESRLAYNELADGRDYLRSAYATRAAKEGGSVPELKWGRTFPHWLPSLGGKHVPSWVPLVLPGQIEPWSDRDGGERSRRPRWAGRRRCYVHHVGFCRSYGRARRHRP